MRKGYERGINRSSRLEALREKALQKTHTTNRKTLASEPPYQQRSIPATLFKMETPAQAPTSEPFEIPKNTSPPDRMHPMAASKTDR